jgi:hypothetical protein
MLPLIVKRGFQRIEKLGGENEVPEARAESLAAATLEKHDAIIRRNLGTNEKGDGSGGNIRTFYLAEAPRLGHITKRPCT